MATGNGGSGINVQNSESSTLVRNTGSNNAMDGFNINGDTVTLIGEHGRR